MHLSFEPAICQLAPLVLPIQSGHYDLRFKATFESRAAYEQARRDGTRVEMWTDLPIAGTAYEGGWRALVFQYEDGELLIDNGARQDESVLIISSGPNTADKKNGEETSVYLSVRLSSENITPAFAGADVKFSFTYRVVWPSGNVQWLGDYGRNGVILVRRGETRLHYSRVVSCEDGLEVVSSEVGPSEEVARLSNEFLWESWAAGKAGRPVFSPTYATAPSSSVLLIPRLPAGTHSVVVPQPLNLSASPGSLISVSSSGVITSRNSEGVPSEVYLLSGDHAQDKFLSSLRESTQVVKYDSESGFVILASVASEEEEVILPITLSFIPISAKTQHTTYASLSATLRAFASLLPPTTKDEREIVLYHKRLGVISCISIPPSITSELVNLRVSSSGDQVVLAPLYNLPTKQEHIEKEDPWKVSVLTPHGPVKVISPSPEFPEPASTLPTPPPSPPFLNSSLMPDIQTVLESASLDVADAPKEADVSDIITPAEPEVPTPEEILEDEAAAEDGEDEDEVEPVKDGEVVAPEEPEASPSSSSAPKKLTSLVIQAVQEADKRVGLRAARSIFRNRSVFRLLLNFSVQVLFTRLFGALGFVLALVGWKKQGGESVVQGARIEEVEDEVEDEVVESPMEIEEVPTPTPGESPDQEQVLQVRAEEETVSVPSPIEESISARDDETQSEATFVEDASDKPVPEPTSPVLPGALDLSDMHPVEYLPRRLSTQLHSRLAAFLLRSPFSNPDSSPAQITITVNGKPVSALYHKVASQDQSVPFHLFEFTASSKGGQVEISAA